MDILRWLGRIHDLITRAGAVASALCLGTIALLYCSEVLSRYFFHSPTSWTAAVSIYLMLATTMLMIPYLTMTKDHVAVTLDDYLSPSLARGLAIFALMAAALVCLSSAYFTYEEMMRAFKRGTRTTDTLFIPKWWLLALMVYGLFSASIHFTRQLLNTVAERHSAEDAHA